MRFRSISVQELKRKMDAREPLTLVDVREPWEYEIAQIDGSKLIPLGELEDAAGGTCRGKESWSCNATAACAANTGHGCSRRRDLRMFTISRAESRRGRGTWIRRCRDISQYRTRLLRLVDRFSQRRGTGQVIPPSHQTAPPVEDENREFCRRRRYAQLRDSLPVEIRHDINIVARIAREFAFPSKFFAAFSPPHPAGAG